MRSLITRLPRVLAMIGVLSFLGARPVLAQACLGIGSVGGQGFLVGSAGFTDGAWGPGGSIGYDTSGPVTVGANFTYTLVDNSDLAVADVGGFLAAEGPNIPVSLCPVASVSYEWLANDGGFTGLDADGVILEGGLALGGRIESTPDFAFIPSISALVVHNRASASVGGFSATGSETFGAFSGSMTMVFGSVFFGPSVGITTLDGADPVFTAILGFTY
ncbi:MAG: hypothetical protein ACE5HQ_13940 [Gemmatimonadota bacterium]